MTKGYLMASLIEKMQSPDQDFRFMGLNDLMAEVKQDPSCYVGDEPMEFKVLHQVLALVEDRISEVKNQAVKCLGQLIKIIRQPQMETVVDKLIEFSGGQDEELRDISGLALKTITAELPPDGRIAASACAKLTPKLLGQIGDSKTPPEALVETLSILSILISRFPALLLNASLNPEPLPVLTSLLSHPRPVVRKRAIVTLSQFIPISRPALFDELMSTIILPNLDSSTHIERYRTTVHLIAAVAKHSPVQLAPVISKIIPGLLKAVQTDDDELREGALQALEAAVLRCPVEITGHLENVIQAGNQYIKYDPNYTGDDDSEMDIDEEVDESDEIEDRYSDDEDTSYKIRRSATKLLAAVISTRPELLTILYKNVSPVLISRFSDREPTVRVEVWATYAVLLNQTAIYGGLPYRNDEHSPRGKRKRDMDEVMETEDSPYNLLKSQVPSLSKSLLAQLKSAKTPPVTLQAGFRLLHALLNVLPGSLSTQIPLVFSVSSSILLHPPTTSTSSLHFTCLTFLALFFSTHTPATFSSSLPNLIPALLRSLAERHPRVASETFRVFSALLISSKPITSSEWVDPVYELAVSKLSTHDTDAEVRACAEECLADLWVCATQAVQKRDGKEWEAIRKTSGNTDGAVSVVTKVAKEVHVSDAWVNDCLDWLMTMLKKSGRQGKSEIFNAVNVLLRSYRSGIPPTLAPALITKIKPFISTSDVCLLSQSLTVFALLLSLSPRATFPLLERDLLRDIYNIVHSPLLSNSALEALLTFFAALVQADDQIAMHVVPNLVISIEKVPKADGNPANVSKCIAQIVKSQPIVAAGTIAEYSKNLKNSAKAKSSLVVLSLLIVGELGRFIDMSNQKDVFTNSLEHFSSEHEEIRVAAAFAAGNIAIGNLHQFLPTITQLVENDSKKRLLSLHALKEVVTHSSQAQLESIADVLWKPLFQNSENSSEETSRNVAAACIGKLATTHPSRYLPQLHALIHDQSSATRATVVSAVRYTFADVSQSYDELLGPLLVDFLSLMTDEDLTVRRLALSALNSATRTKPHLIKDHLSMLLPSLYAETVVKPDLIRTVQMGPWTHKEDIGLDARKTAYETLYTLLDTCLAKIELHEFLTRVIAGLSDDSDEIQVITHMLLFRLSQVAPNAVSRRLDEIGSLLEKTMQGKSVMKDTVKQDLERAAELQRSALRALAALSKIGSGISPKFDAVVEQVLRGTMWGSEFKELLANGVA